MLTQADPSTARDAAADVLVIFGITGDLARVMTFLPQADDLVKGHSRWYGPWIAS